MFLDEVKSTTPGSKVNWQYLARKYNVLNKNGIRPLNGGQVLKQFAQDNGVNIHSFNPQSRVSGRDYIRRVRRAKKIDQANIYTISQNRQQHQINCQEKARYWCDQHSGKNHSTRITSNTINKEEVFGIYIAKVNILPESNFTMSDEIGKVVT
ncbi:unnamed protein product [Mytilus edulis]|uniref:Uncharacterized protein n=1 Tax=Mytilus edulis TaxID=6550 RepID=A0A8S3QD54_MYTED|nr:unnamed protein product [Mytilus edulis]